MIHRSIGGMILHARLVKEDTSVTMHVRLFRYDGGINVITYGLFSESRCSCPRTRRYKFKEEMGERKRGERRRGRRERKNGGMEEGREKRKRAGEEGREEEERIGKGKEMERNGGETGRQARTQDFEKRGLRGKHTKPHPLLMTTPIVMCLSLVYMLINLLSRMLPNCWEQHI